MAGLGLRRDEGGRERDRGAAGEVIAKPAGSLAARGQDAGSAPRPPDDRVEGVVVGAEPELAHAPERVREVTRGSQRQRARRPWGAQLVDPGRLGNQLAEDARRRGLDHGGPEMEEDDGVVAAV